MASSRALLLPLLLVAFAVTSGVFLKGVNGDPASSFVRRRLVGHQTLWGGAGLATEVPEGSCPWKCTGTPLPTCCQLESDENLPGLFYCANTAMDKINCGACGKACPVGTDCCDGACSNLRTDPSNCGVCGNKCPAGDNCEWRMCNYAK